MPWTSPKLHCSHRLLHSPVLIFDSLANILSLVVGTEVVFRTGTPVLLVADMAPQVDTVDTVVVRVTECLTWAPT